MVCSQKRALCIAGLVCGSLLMTAFIIAYGGQSSGCNCSSPNFINNSKTPNLTAPLKPIATNGDPFPWLEEDLPKFTKPISYTITIHPNLTTHDIKGQVLVEFNVQEETEFIVIHSQKLNISDKSIMLSGHKMQYTKITRLLEFVPRQHVYIEFKEKLKPKNNYTLNLKWFSRLNFKPDGFYLDQYENKDGTYRSIATTVIQPYGARKIFPCFNEPQFRTQFRISIFRDRFHIGLSNSNVYKTEDVGFYMGTGLLKDDFIETPRLPSDWISFAVSDFEKQFIYSESDLTKNTHISILNEKSPLKITATSKGAKKTPVQNIAYLTHSLSLEALSVNSTLLNASLSIDHKSNNNFSRSKVNKTPSYTYYAPKELLAGAFIVKTSVDVLTYFESWINIGYPLTKLDFIAVPSLKQNVISSLGCIRLKVAFLMDQNSTTTKESQISALRISEAVVQQFFGGITSPHLLKENSFWDGLVKYLAIIMLSSFRQYRHLTNIYTLHLVTKTMDRDALQSSPSVVSGTMDGLSREFLTDKNVAIFGMLHSTIGDTIFRNCLRNFLKDNRFKTGFIEDIWILCNKSQEKQHEVNVMVMMHSWIKQSGYPLVNISRYQSEITIEQYSFRRARSQLVVNHTYTFSDRKETLYNATSNMTTWYFPLKYITDRQKIPKQIWINRTKVSLQVSNETKWLKFNSGQSGFYRVTYNQGNWLSLVQELTRNHEIFNTEDRIGLLSDAFTLCHANLLSCDIVMNMVVYLPNESQWSPITTALTYIERWRRILKFSECFLLLSEFIKAKMTLNIEKIGLDDNGDIEKRMLRPEIILALVLWEDASMIAKSRDMFNKFLFRKNETVAPNLKEAIYTGAILSGEYIYWQFCWERFLMLQRLPGNNTERKQLLRALGRTKDVWLQNRLLSHSTILSTSEVVEILRSVAGTPTGGAIACRFLQANWFNLESRLGKGTEHFANVIAIITQYGSTNFDYDELNSLIFRFGGGPGLGILQMTAEAVASNVNWLTRSQSSIYKWIEQHLRID